LLTAVCFIGVIVVREWIAYSNVLYSCDCFLRVNFLQQCALLLWLWLEIELLTAVCFIGVIVFREWIDYSSLLYWCDVVREWIAYSSMLYWCDCG